MATLKDETLQKSTVEIVPVLEQVGEVMTNALSKNELMDLVGTELAKLSSEGQKLSEVNLIGLVKQIIDGTNKTIESGIVQEVVDSIAASRILEEIEKTV
jgi:hypothetical protein